MTTIFYYDDGLKQGTLEELPNLLNFKIWIDITNISQKEAELIGKTFLLHPLTIEDLNQFIQE